MVLVFYGEHMFQNICSTYVKHMLNICCNFTCVTVFVCPPVCLSLVANFIRVFLAQMLHILTHSFLGVLYSGIYFCTNQIPCQLPLICRLCLILDYISYQICITDISATINRNCLKF